MAQDVARTSKIQGFHAVKFIHSLAFKLIALGVVLVLAGNTLRYFVIGDVLKTGVAEVLSAQQSSLASYVAEDINGKVLARQAALAQLAAQLPRQALQQPNDAQAWLQSKATTLPLFNLGLVLVAVDGHGAVADFPVIAGRRQLDFNDRDWFVATRDGADFSIGRPSIGRAAKEAVVNMAVPVRNAQQQVVGVLMGVSAINAPGFLDLMQTVRVGKTGGLLLISPRDHVIVTASDSSMRLAPTPAPGVNPLHDQAMQGWTGSGITRNAQGTEELATVVPVPAAHWFLVVRMPVQEACGVVQRLFASIVGNSLQIGALLTVVMVALLAYLFHPLKHAATQMRAMARGQLALAPLPVVRHDEVGEMVQSFNELVDKLLQSEARMRYLAHHDTLTGLPNRMAFQQSLSQSVALAERQHGSLALLFIDLDGFKAVNDTHGHDAGDQLLQQLALRLRTCVRASDIVGRLGGDEFVVLLTDNPDAQATAQIADKLIACIAQAFDLQGVQATLGASVGIGMYPADADSADQLLIVADAAMYQAKRTGGRRHRTATGATQTE